MRRKQIFYQEIDPVLRSPKKGGVMSQFGIRAKLHTKDLNAGVCLGFTFLVCSPVERYSGVAPLREGPAEPSAKIESTFGA